MRGVIERRKSAERDKSVAGAANYEADPALVINKTRWLWEELQRAAGVEACI